MNQRFQNDDISEKDFWQMNSNQAQTLVTSRTNILLEKQITFRTWGNSNLINLNFNSAILPLQEKYVTLFFIIILLKDKSNTGQTKQYVLA